MPPDRSAEHREIIRYSSIDLMKVETNSEQEFFNFNNAQTHNIQNMTKLFRKNFISLDTLKMI